MVRVGLGMLGLFATLNGELGEERKRNCFDSGNDMTCMQVCVRVV